MMDALDATCPYCGESVEVAVDPFAGPRQSFVEDCPVCCRPWEVSVRKAATGDWTIELKTVDG
jgi:hypothetical protein